MNRELKQQVVSELKEVFASAGIVIVAKNDGLAVKDAKRLRRSVREAGSSFRVAKNRLIKIALNGSQFEGLGDIINGPVALAYSKDPVAVAKAVNDFAKENEKLKISGGVMDGAFLTPQQVMALAALPSLDELRGKFVGLLQAAASKTVAVLQAPAAQLARVVDAHAKK